MDETLGKTAELRVKHLEMIQSVIARIATNAVTTKNYCITVTTAVCGFAITLQRSPVALLAFLALLSFGLLDAQYLRVERRLRGLFEQVRSENWHSIPTFQINLKDAPSSSYWSALFSWSILSFYLPLAAGIAIVAMIARCAYGI